ncbi:aminopeptidase N [Actinospica sp. MGRD01-02]|uniref:Aminopeptidase N n=1 Tax=Actinospica acidithermotolerans TaxID=2828514 RepID=A0A941IE89_9ACTN|nr:aminopeptidase N [Actinospica acidithermotolerans]MBR7824955.1 aminopeptidase N [Actinospica acidithermotolerans]
MPGTNLTREEAADRARLISVSSYEVELDLTVGPESFGSSSTVRFTAEPGSATFADLVTDGPIHEITLNGRSLDPAAVFADSRIALDGLEAENVLHVRADCQYSHTGEGLHRMVDPVDGGVFLYTQFEVPDARRVFADFEQPDLKAAFRFTVTAPETWELFSNSPTPKPEALGEGRAVWRFEPTERISTYITALVAGDYGVVRKDYTSANGTVIPMAVAARRSLMEYLDADEIFDVTFKGFDYFEAKFDQPYPFPKYDQLFVPEYNAGAMENAGCVTFRESYVFRSKVTDASYERRAETILHELAHMWFGDLVTMEWWNDLWLNESFATYASVRCQADATRWSGAWTTFANAEKTWAYAQDQLPSTHPIVAEIPDLEAVYVNFDGITYAKGASVLKQLVAYVGDEAFFQGLRTYFRRHAWGNTRLSDLLGALEEASGRDLAAWSKAWLETAGPNTLRAEFTLAEDGTYATFAVLQEAPKDYPTLRPHRIAIGLYERGETGLARVRRVELDVDGARTEVPELVGERQPDVLVLNDDDLSYAKIRFDERSIATLIESIGEFTESLPRALAWVSTWDMMRNGELAASAYVPLVLSGAAKETQIGVLQSLQGQAKSAIELYAAPQHREALAERWAAFAHEQLLAAAPGSDIQLSWAKALASSALTEAQLSLLGGLLDGSEQIDGLTVDTDLRWALLARLAAMGRADAAQIDAELAQDPTAAGKRHALTCRAAIPTAEAKEEAWASAVESDKLTNEELLAVIAGFKQNEQRELLQPYVARYFEVVTRLWAERTPHMAQMLVAGLYPLLTVDQAVVDAVDVVLAETDEKVVPPALRRMLLEQRDGTLRLLRGQAVDANA